MSMSTLDRPLRGATETVAVGEARLANLRELIAQSSGLPASPESRALVQRRAETFVQRLGLARLDELLQTEDVAALRNLVAVDCSWFWRDSAQLDTLVNHLQLRVQGGPSSGPVATPLRVWSAATAKGEEAYSMAIALCEAGLSSSVSIWATDINAQSIADAQTGCYGERSLAQLPPALKEAYLEPTGQGHSAYTVAARLKKMVSFGVADLLALALADAPLFAAIFCRNVLIYFDPPYRYAVLEALAARLLPKGLLFLGVTETVGTAAQLFTSHGRGVFQIRASGSIGGST